MLQEIIKEFEDKVNEHYGIYLNTLAGFVQFKMLFEKAQTAIVENKKTTIQLMDESPFYHYDGESNIHEQTQGQLKMSLDQEGETYLFIGQMILTSIYGFWEDYYRGKIATVKQLKKDELKSDIFGDIKHLRHSIIHHKGTSLKDVEKCKILQWYKEGDVIQMDEMKIKAIINEIRIYLLSLK